MRHNAVNAVVRATRGHHNHLALSFAQRGCFLEHECVVIGKKRTAFIGPMRKCQEHIRDEAGLLLHVEHACAKIFRNVGQLRHRKARDRIHTVT